jgi:hypothetical protein
MVGEVDKVAKSFGYLRLRRMQARETQDLQQSRRQIEGEKCRKGEKEKGRRTCRILERHKRETGKEGRDISLSIRCRDQVPSLGDMDGFWFPYRVHLVSGQAPVTRVVSYIFLAVSMSQPMGLRAQKSKERLLMEVNGCVCMLLCRSCSSLKQCLSYAKRTSTTNVHGQNSI